GLDYDWDKSGKDVEEGLFRKEIGLGKGVNLGIMIDNREGREDCVNIVKEEEGEEIGGIMERFRG
ncbi:TatD family hydrolase, partial [Staphylococcus saprophyticus]|uniref:TatD family hydrolase n=1 Tax=Staphylococcus saprophyticus TaxID=29385 RepID=UPI001642CF51